MFAQGLRHSPQAWQRVAAAPSSWLAMKRVHQSSPQHGLSVWGSSKRARSRSPGRESSAAASFVHSTGVGLRRGSSSGVLPSPSKSSAGSADLDDDPAPELDPNHIEARCCLGCLRSGHHSTSFFSEEPVEWLYDSQRGSWCRECHTVWRHTRQGTDTRR